ncbi:hypothetical protein [Paraglaciecola sp.]|uniref:hypothetical protein n=1 Tax=Paraglaciecola sp. TaxID=1920173 RepID=UPI00273E77C3|nr:hypothetical protein [Paraglaciecola sp.]MDP5032084.1 hypothetical protein [Paraglaciecola sp.]
MDSSDIEKIVVNALQLTNQSRSDNTQIPISESTVLFGKDGHLDSMALVALLMDIEDALAEESIDVSLSDEKAMSSSRSPFKNLTSMTQYISDVIAEQS